jgi:uncharacterized membrane protein YoaK (UPF0700 family)
MRNLDKSDAGRTLDSQANDDVGLTLLKRWLPPLLSVIAGMADLIGFFTLGNIFTAHLTGNLVLATAALVRHAPVELGQVLAIPAFVFAVMGVWLITRVSGRRSVGLVRLLLLIQFILLAAVMAVSVLTRASTEPEGLMACVAGLIAVAAMASQYALIRLAMPDVVSTAVMTGNLTNTVLLSMNSWFKGRFSMTDEGTGLARSVSSLVGFLCGCAIAGVAVLRLADWAWIFPVTLAGVAVLIVTYAPEETW